MKRAFWAGFWVIFVMALGVGCFTLLTPKIGTASRAQIEAVLPASLKEQDPPNPEGVKRYERLAAIVNGLRYNDVEKAMGTPRVPGDPAAKSRALNSGKAAMEEVSKLLDEGDLWYPERKITTLFKDSPNLKSFCKLIALATQDAADRGDTASAAYYAKLGLRYGKALSNGGGVLIDTLVGIATEAIAVRSVYEAEMKGAFDANGRTAVLALLPEENGVLPQMGASVRRDFQAMCMPLLLDPVKQITQADQVLNNEEKSNRTSPGTFDPVETARLLGQIYEASMKDATLPLDQQSHLANKLAEEAAVGLPKAGSGPEFWYRMRMNIGRNTIGRTYASVGIFEQLSTVVRRRAAERNIVRSVILLREGQSPALMDPFGKGPLKIDRKRHIVWSVGEDGVDNGGDIPTGTSSKSPDQGHKW